MFETMYLIQTAAKKKMVKFIFIYDYDRHGAREILTASFTEHDILEGRFDSPNSYYRRLVSKATGPKTDSVKG